MSRIKLGRTRPRPDVHRTDAPDPTMHSDWRVRAFSARFTDSEEVVDRLLGDPIHNVRYAAWEASLSLKDTWFSEVVSRGWRLGAARSLTEAGFGLADLPQARTLEATVLLAEIQMNSNDAWWDRTDDDNEARVTISGGASPVL